MNVLLFFMIGRFDKLDALCRYIANRTAVPVAVVVAVVVALWWSRWWWWWWHLWWWWRWR
jgi:hypothetical protein